MAAIRRPSANGKPSGLIEERRFRSTRHVDQVRSEARRVRRLLPDYSSLVLFGGELGKSFDHTRLRDDYRKFVSERKWHVGSGGSDANGDAGRDKMPNSDRNVMPLPDQHKPN